MKRLLIGLLLASGVTLAAADYTKYAALTVDATSGGVGFAAASIAAQDGHVAAKQATCRLETAQIRYTYDGSAPTSTAGILWEVGEEKILDTRAKADLLQVFRAIRTGASSGTLQCHFLG